MLSEPSVSPLTGPAADVTGAMDGAMVSDVPRSAIAKRVLNLMVAVPLVVLLSPLLLTVAVLVRLTSPGPVLFRQVRVGRGERPFTMLKFRTMRVGGDDRLHRDFNLRELQDDSAAPGGIFKPANDPRVTAIGGFLRRFSVDELPQLINVIRGEMSLVGPRPALPWEVALFTPEQRRRHCCLPGMTGLWQVSGRNRLSMPQMLELDLRYCRKASLATDLGILLRTPKTVLFERATR